MQSYTFKRDLGSGVGSAGAAGIKSSGSGPKPILDLPPGGANTLLLLFAQGSSPEYITVELAAISQSLLVLFQIRSGRWRRHKKVAETYSRTHGVFLRPGPIKVHPTWLLLVQVPVLTTVSAPAWKITTGSLSALTRSIQQTARNLQRIKL